MADSVIDLVARILRPILIVPARYLARPKKGSTWHYEAAFVAAVLIAVAVLTTPPFPTSLTDIAAIKTFLIIWLSAAAVFGSFLHAQVGTYMAEDMGGSEKPLTECYYKLGEYWIYKEIFWFLVFLLSGAYPAIAGNIIFLIFPAWRKIYKGIRSEDMDVSKETNFSEGKSVLHDMNIRPGSDSTNMQEHSLLHVRSSPDA